MNQSKLYLLKKLLIPNVNKVAKGKKSMCVTGVVGWGGGVHYNPIGFTFLHMPKFNPELAESEKEVATSGLQRKLLNQIL